MQTEGKPGRNAPLFAQIAAFALTVGLQYGLWRLSGGEERPGANQLILAIVGILLALAVSLIVGGWIRALLKHQHLEQQVTHSKQKSESLKTRLDGLSRLSSLLIDAQGEKELIERSLGVIADTWGAIGCSFLPFDEWGIALTPYTSGSFPAPVLRAWSDLLSTPSVRQDCQACTKFSANPGDPCNLLGVPFVNESIRIYCLPLDRGGRMVAMLNIYLSVNQALTGEDLEFTRLLLHQMSAAIEMLKLRNQEQATLRQLQMVSGQTEDIEGSIRGLVEGLNEVADIEGARVDIKPSEPRFPGLHLIFKSNAWLSSEAGQALAEQTLTRLTDKDVSPVSVLYVDQIGMVLSTPIRMSSGVIVGALLLTADPETFFEREHLSMVETTAAQIAMVIENQREQLNAQFRIVMAERIRLAREIHDSLAQTLAYLKLTAAQMQNLLAHGDLSRLEQILNQSYQALSEAYLEIREVIDNLRIVPKQSIADLLHQLADDFEKTTGLEVETKFLASVPEVIPEVQAQLLRVVQEALSNVRKHANAKTVQISLGVWNRQMFIEVSDNGIGFDAEDVPELSRHGLQGMRERAELIGADFQVISQTGKGTRVRLQLPPVIEEKLV